MIKKILDPLVTILCCGAIIVWFPLRVLADRLTGRASDF